MFASERRRVTMLANMDGATPAAANGISKFPAFAPEPFSTRYEEGTYHNSSSSPSHDVRRSVDTDRWQPRRSSRAQWNPSAYPPPGARHGRQKSLSEALRTIRTRSGSMSQNAHEIADALKAPVSPTLVVCIHYVHNRARCQGLIE